ncbi:DUF2199 domain-containing protein [Neobacillus piezotolerans]|uniref:DUF2199 domain-containing protein n=1 Tax=Neobacillus piezotolerans TaxID=2259171 RepID=A0A3D8GN29_9BACI|nr:DUF2199 domain-containing protein [Neobacillus piezotolerans]RDU35639.1 DUF2199 domain-containing protein [Neobacillus piezotolerans]
MTKIEGYACSCCGHYHEELPRSYGTPAPVYYYYIDPEEREDKFELSDDLCVMDNEHFFIRGCIEIPILGTEEHFIWGVWVSLNEANFNKVKEYWDKQEQLEPMFGWLSTELSCYPDTVNLKAMTHFRPDGIRPFIELEPTDHPLAVEFREGITLERVKEIAEYYCGTQDN